MRKIKLALLMGLIILPGCIFKKCSNEEKRVAFSAMTERADGCVPRADGCYFEGGRICRWNTSCAETLVAFPNEHLTRIKVMQMHLNDQLPLGAPDELRELGFAEGEVDAVQANAPQHFSHMTRLYWCARRHSAAFCRLFGIGNKAADLKEYIPPAQIDNIPSDLEQKDFQKYSR